MTTVFKDGFESGNFSAWSSTTGSVTVVSTLSHGGTKAAQATSGNSHWEKDLGTGHSDLFFSGYVKIPSMLANTQKTYMLEIFDSSYAQWIAGGLKREANGNTYWILVVNNNTNVFNSVDPNPVQTNQWYFMEIEYNTNGTAKLWVEGNLMCTATGQTLTNNARKVQGGNPNSITPAGFISYGDDYAANIYENNPSDVDNSNIVNLLKIKTYQSGDWINIRNILSPTLAPLLQIDQGMWCKKDIFSNGFLGTSSPTDGPFAGTGGGAVMIGHGFINAATPPCIILPDTNYSTLYLYTNATTGALAKMTLGTLTAIDEMNIPVRTSDPGSPAEGSIWLRSNL